MPKLDPLADCEAGYGQDHHLEPARGFDYDEIDRRLGLVEPPREPHREEVIKATGEALHGLIDFIVCRGGSRTNPTSIGRRMLALCCVLQHPAINGQSMTRLAEELNVTKQAVSKIATEISRRWGLHSRGMKSFEARAHYSELRKKNHWRRKRKEQNVI